MVKLEGLKQNYKTYGGMSCIKIGLTIDDTLKLAVPRI